MKITLQHYSPAPIFGLPSLSANNGTSSNHEYLLDLPASAGEGKIATYNFGHGYKLFILKGRLWQDWEWEFNADRSSPLFSLLLAKGSVEGVFHQEQERYTLRQMETFIALEPFGGRQSIIFKGGEDIHFVALRIERQEFMERYAPEIYKLPHQVQALFIKDETTRCVLPPVAETYHCARLLNDISDCTMEGVVRSCFIEARAMEMLALNFQRVTRHADVEAAPKKLPLAVDETLMRRAKTLLLENLENAPTIEVLSKLLGTNRQKLQQDFKVVHGMTVGQLLRQEQMGAAMKFLQTGKFSIREVAVKVGYQNQSHFSKRFEEHFGYLPMQCLRTLHG